SAEPASGCRSRTSWSIQRQRFACRKRSGVPGLRDDQACPAWAPRSQPQRTWALSRPSWPEPPPWNLWPALLFCCLYRCSYINHFAVGLEKPDTTSVFQLPDADPVSLLGDRVEQSHVRHVDRHFLVNDSAGGAFGGIRTLVLFNAVDAL